MSLNRFFFSNKRYYDTSIKEKAQGLTLMVTGYEGILDELRTQEREL